MSNPLHFPPLPCALTLRSPHQASNLSWGLVRYTNSQGPDSWYGILGVTLQCFQLGDSNACLRLRAPALNPSVLLKWPPLPFDLLFILQVLAQMFTLPGSLFFFTQENNPPPSIPKPQCLCLTPTMCSLVGYIHISIPPQIVRILWVGGLVFVITAFSQPWIQWFPPRK